MRVYSTDRVRTPCAPLPPGARVWGAARTPSAAPLESAAPLGAGRVRGSPRYRGKPLLTHGSFCTELRNVFTFQITSSLSTSRHEGMPALGLPWVTVA